MTSSPTTRPGPERVGSYTMLFGIRSMQSTVSSDGDGSVDRSPIKPSTLGFTGVLPLKLGAKMNRSGNLVA